VRQEPPRVPRVESYGKYRTTPEEGQLNDPHVKELRYRIETADDLVFHDPAMVEDETDDEALFRDLWEDEGERETILTILQAACEILPGGPEN
jgi:hypothetical protein